MRAAVGTEELLKLLGGLDKLAAARFAASTGLRFRFSGIDAAISLGGCEPCA